MALFSPTTPSKDLQAHPDFKTATHRLAAWRTPSAQRTLHSSSPRGVFDVGHDDDGEHYGGKRLEKVLKEANVEGAVVVARWYGGILLGPVRFTHIENCAREAIEKSKKDARERDLHVALKRKVEGDEKRRSTLVRILEERDHSIHTLRGLLREKTKEASCLQKDEIVSAVRDTNTTPTKAINYSAMPLQALEQLEKARDATISWILKEIEKAEGLQQESKQISATDLG
jgi:Uncharacterized protein family UPF0029